MTPEEYCQDKAARSGSSFYYSFLFLPEQRRKAIIALYAFCREVDDVIDDCHDPVVAESKLQWWRDEINRLFQQQPNHPVTRALLPVIQQFDLAEEYFQEIIDGMQMDLQQQRYASFTDLRLYCYRVASVVGLLSAEIFGYSDRQTLKYASDLGMAFQLTNILRDVREDAMRGRIYLPLEDLQQFGVTETDILQGRDTEAFHQLMAFETQRAREYYAQAFQHLPRSDRYPQRAGVIMAAIYRTLLDEIERDGYRVLQHRIALTPLRKLWLAWKTLYHEKRHYRRYAVITET